MPWATEPLLEEVKTTFVIQPRTIPSRIGRLASSGRQYLRPLECRPLEYKPSSEDHILLLDL